MHSAAKNFCPVVCCLHAACNLTPLIAAPEHGGSHCLAQAKIRTQAPSCTSNAVTMQRRKAASRRPLHAQNSFPEVAESSFDLQPVSMSATHGCAYQASLPQGAAHVKVPCRKPQSNMQVSESTSIGRSRSTWSSFVEHNDETPQAHDDSKLFSNISDSSDFVTAFN